MCYFPISNDRVDSVAFQKGVREFECGACPECLKRRASKWSLRAFYEAQQYVDNCMITLTYDNFERDDKGRKTGRELPPDRSLHVCKRDLQLFFKRLRKAFPERKIKYIATAEYGSHTHRAHYHCILFNCAFDDKVPYKKSKRGSQIYTSATLERIWQHGICTVDSVNITSAVARYCTKYCAKSRSEDTFMLFSQHIGEIGLLRDFNGLYYTVEGVQYPVPRFIWQKVITERYSSKYPVMTYKYLNKNFVPPRNYDYRYYHIDSLQRFDEYRYNTLQRALFREIRDSDSQYQKYLKYWSDKSEQFQMLLPTVEKRILSLPNEKYFNYKQLALIALQKRHDCVPVPGPGSKCISAYARYLYSIGRELLENRSGSYLDLIDVSSKPLLHVFKYSVILNYPRRPCRYRPCLLTASDTKMQSWQLGFGWRKKILQNIL